MCLFRGKTGFGWMGNIVLFSEAASCQLEFKYLAKLTGRADYYEKVWPLCTLVVVPRTNGFTG
jgi:hypothetical protein